MVRRGRIRPQREGAFLDSRYKADCVEAFLIVLCFETDYRDALKGLAGNAITRLPLQGFPRKYNCSATSGPTAPDFIGALS